MLSPKQRRFAEEYIVDYNATQAAIRAGYSVKTAYSAGGRALKNVEIKAYIDKRLSALEEKSIAKAEEVLKYLTSVMRGDSESEIVVVEGTGDGLSAARHVKKNPDEKEKLKAAELIGKRYGMFTDKVEQSGEVSVKVSGEISVEDKLQAIKEFSATDIDALIVGEDNGTETE